MFWLRLRGVARKYKQNGLANLAAANLREGILALDAAAELDALFGAIETLERVATEGVDERLAMITVTLRGELGLDQLRRLLPVDGR